jgi:hypothetical protein
MSSTAAIMKRFEQISDEDLNKTNLLAMLLLNVCKFFVCVSMLAAKMFVIQTRHYKLK